jgi:fumarate reductase subunit D
VSAQAPTKPPPIREAQSSGDQVARSRGFEWLARAGFVARGLIYGIVGILAIKLAVGAGGTTADQQGALKTVAHQPFGKILLILVTIGLAGYALWRLVHGLLGHGPEDTDSRFDRLAAFGSAIVYAVLCALAIEILLGSGSSGGSGNTSTAAAGVFGWPGGTWLVGIAGAVLIGVGLYQGYRGLSKDFLRDSKTEQMSPQVRNWVEWIGSFGHLARMVVFGLVGTFLIKAAVDFNPNKAVGLDGALAKLARAPYGPFVLGLVAAGLIAFGVYSLSDARYRRI